MMLTTECEITHGRSEIQDAINTEIERFAPEKGIIDFNNLLSKSSFEELRSMGYVVDGIEHIDESYQTYNGGETRVWLKSANDEDNEELPEFARSCLMDMVNDDVNSETKQAILSVFETLGYDVERKYTLD